MRESQKTRPRPHRLVPLYRDGPREPREGVAAAWIAHRLHRRFAGEAVRTLEALAAAEANRLRAGAAAAGGLAASVPEAPDDPLHRACLRIARRALAEEAESPVGTATCYHREGVLPAWAEGRAPVAELGGFLFYE